MRGALSQSKDDARVDQILLPDIDHLPLREHFYDFVLP